VFRTQKRRNPPTGTGYLWLARATAQVNYFYFYCVDDGFGPFFIKFCSYFPYNAKLCLNGNHWAQRQADKAGIGFIPLDNAFAAVDDVPALQGICDSLGETHLPGPAGQVAARPAAPVHRGGRRRRIPLRHLHRAGRVLPDPDARPPGHRPDLPRGLGRRSDDGPRSMLSTSTRGFHVGGARGSGLSSGLRMWRAKGVRWSR